MNPTSFVTSSVGGLRLQEVLIHDGFDTNKDIVQTFEYSPFGSTESSGILFYDDNQYVTGVSAFGSNIAQALFFSYPSYPLQNFFGSHLTYEYVTVNYKDNGRTEYTFKEPDIPFFFEFPLVPSNYDKSIGFVTKTDAHREGAGTTLKQSSTTAQKIEGHDGVVGGFVARKIPFYDSGSVVYDHVVTNLYTNFTNLSRIESSTVDIDGFSSTTTYDYFSGNTQFQPLKTKLINSDGKEYVTTLNYTHDYWWGWTDPNNSNYQDCLADEFVEKNIRNINWFTATNVLNSNNNSGETISRNRTEYKLYDDNGVQTTCSSVSNPNKHLRPFEIYNYARTWDESNNILPGNWELVSTMEEYTNDGLIEKVSKPNWIYNTTYQYDNKRLIQSSFGDLNNEQVSSYIYFGDSKLLESQTDITGLSTSYIYDDLNRLMKVTEDCSGIFTEYDYKFASSNPTEPENKITTTVDFNGSGGSNLATTIETIQYMDGLGRPVQTVGKHHEPGANKNGDIIHAQEYDNFGRNLKSYFPQVTSFSNNGEYVVPQASWEYSENDYEKSSLSRLENNDPMGHESSSNEGSIPGDTYIFGTNESTDLVYDWENSQNFPNGVLKKTTIQNGTGHQRITFVDRIGNTILSRITPSDGSEFSDTYFIYDDRGRLKTVIPEGADLTTTDLLYNYVYYKDDKINSKKLPGADEIITKYNDKGLLGLVQDGNTRTENSDKWLASNYDDFGRAIETGFYVDNSNLTNESFSDVTISSSDQLTTQTYTTDHLEDESTSRILDSNDFITVKKEYMAPCHRLQFVKSNTHLTLTDMDALKTQFVYDHTGSVQKEKISFKQDATTTHYLTHFYYYDNELRDRLYKVDPVDFTGSNWTTVSLLTFNEREQLTKKNLGYSGGDLQQLNYEYTDWGALKSINGPGTYGTEYQIADGGLNFDTQSNLNRRDLFSMNIYYDEEFDSDGNGTAENTTLETGGISAVRWQTRGRRENVYTYEYNFKDELLSADFYEQNAQGVDDDYTKTDLFSTSYSYEDRGLINSISRGDLDMLEFIDPPIPDPIFNSCTSSVTLTYVNNSNHIQDRVEIKCPGFAYPLYQGINYDNNGNKTDDPYNRNIEYNYLNLISSYEENGQNSYNATFSADGSRLNANQFDFVGPFEFRNGNINRKHFEEGFEDANSELNYIISDYLGNVRIAFNDIDSDNLINSIEDVQDEFHYYPFGLKMYGPWMSLLNNDFEYQYNGIELEDNFDLDWNTATYRSLDPTLGRWFQIDPYAESFYSMSTYCSMNNNPISFSDPEGDFPLLAVAIGMGIGALTNTATQAISNGGFNNWNWGAFAGSVVAGGVGGGVSSAMTSAGIGGFYGGAVTGGASGFSQNLTAGLINGNLTAGGLAKSIFFGAGIGGTIQGLGAAIDGRRFSDGARLIETQTLADQSISLVKQDGANNCLCASAEAVDGSFGGSVTQDQARGWFPGTNAETDGLGDVPFWNKYSSNTGHKVVGVQASSSTTNAIPQAMGLGRRVAVNLDVSGNVGHSVVMDNVIKQTYKRVNGSLFSKSIFNAMNPATGSIASYSSGYISNAHAIFFIYP